MKRSISQNPYFSDKKKVLPQKILFENDCYLYLIRVLVIVILHQNFKKIKYEINALVRPQGVMTDGFVKKILYPLQFGCIGHNYNVFKKKAEVTIW